MVLVLPRMGMGESRLCVTLLDIKDTSREGISNSFGKPTPQPHARGTRGDDQYAAKLYVPARFEIAGRAYERPLFSAAIAVSYIHTLRSWFFLTFNCLSPFP